VRSRVLGLAALIVLIGAVVWQWHADDADARAHLLTSLDPDAVSHIDVALKGLPAQRFDRRDGHWSDGAATVDEGRAGELVMLAATPVSAWRPVADFDLAKIGLSPPVAVLVLDGTRIEFGEMAALRKQRYARVGDRVAIVPAQALPRAPRTASLPASSSTVH